MTMFASAERAPQTLLASLIPSQQTARQKALSAGKVSARTSNGSLRLILSTALSTRPAVLATTDLMTSVTLAVVAIWDVLPWTLIASLVVTLRSLIPAQVVNAAERPTHVGQRSGPVPPPSSMMDRHVIANVELKTQTVTT